MAVCSQKVSSFLKRAAMVAVGLAAVFAAGGARAAVKSSLDYVQDGLVAQWDGVENAGRLTHDPNATSPVELTGNLSTTLTGTMPAHDTWFEFGSGDLSFVSSDIATAINEGRATIEICLAKNGTVSDPVTGILSFGTTSRGFWLWQWSVSLVGAYSHHSTHSQYAEASFNDAGTNTLYYILGADAASSSFGANGTKRLGLKRWTTNMKTDETCYLGTMPDNPRAKAKVFAVRIYDRVLTADQIATNRAVDVARFIEGNYYDACIYVKGSPSDVGVPSPDYGKAGNLVVGHEYAFTCPDVWTNDAETVGATCRGWTLALADGTETSGPELSKTITYDATMTGATLTWNWDVDYKVTAVAESDGTVTNAGQWVR